MAVFPALAVNTPPATTSTALSSTENVPFFHLCPWRPPLPTPPSQCHMCYFCHARDVRTPTPTLSCARVLAETVGNKSTCHAAHVAAQLLPVCCTSRPLDLPSLRIDQLLNLRKKFSVVTAKVCRDGGRVRKQDGRGLPNGGRDWISEERKACSFGLFAQSSHVLQLASQSRDRSSGLLRHDYRLLQPRNCTSPAPQVDPTAIV